MSRFQQLFTFTVNQLKNPGSQRFYNPEYVNILSVFNGKLLFSREKLSHLYIYTREGFYRSTITTCDDDMLHDAAWTPRGNIVYTAWGIVVVMSESGKFNAKHTQMTRPERLSVSNEDIIYLADWETGVHQSADDGFSWSLVFKSTDGWHCWHAIKITNDHYDSDDFWTLERSTFGAHLHVYSVDRRRSGDNMPWRDIFPIKDGKHVALNSQTIMSYDGNMNFFLGETFSSDVHVLSVNGQYHCQLESSSYMTGLAVDKERQLMFMGHEVALVTAFQLTYGDV